MWMSFFNRSTSTTSNTIRFGEQEDNEWMRIQDGTVGIGTTNPGETLEIRKVSGTNLVKVSTQANSTVGFEIEKTGAILNSSNQ